MPNTTEVREVIVDYIKGHPGCDERQVKVHIKQLYEAPYERNYAQKIFYEMRTSKTWHHYFRNTLITVKDSRSPDVPYGVYRDLRHGKHVGGQTNIQSSSSSGMTRREVQERYDGALRTRMAMKRGCESLKPDDMLEESKFKSEKCSGYDPQYWNDIRDEGEFAKYQFLAPKGQVIWAHADDVEWALSPEGITGSARRI